MKLQMNVVGRQYFQVGWGRASALTIRRNDGDGKERNDPSEDEDEDEKEEGSIERRGASKLGVRAKAGVATETRNGKK